MWITYSLLSSLIPITSRTASYVYHMCNMSDWEAIKQAGYIYAGGEEKVIGDVRPTMAAIFAVLMSRAQRQESGIPGVHATMVKRDDYDIDLLIQPQRPPVA